MRRVFEWEGKLCWTISLFYYIALVLNSVENLRDLAYVILRFKSPECWTIFCEGFIWENWVCLFYTVSLWHHQKWWGNNTKLFWYTLLHSWCHNMLLWCNLFQNINTFEMKIKYMGKSFTKIDIYKTLMIILEKFMFVCLF